MAAAAADYIGSVFRPPHAGLGSSESGTEGVTPHTLAVLWMGSEKPALIEFCGSRCLPLPIGTIVSQVDHVGVARRPLGAQPASLLF